MIQIKKYSNRKFYSLETSGYVRLEYIRGLVNAGTPFRVVDNGTGKNITKQVTFDAFAPTLRGKLSGPELVALANGTGRGIGGALNGTGLVGPSV